MFDAEIKVEFSPHEGKTDTALNSGFHVVDSGFPGTGFQSLVGFRIFLNCILDSKAQDSGFHKQFFFPDSRFHDRELKNFRIPFHGVIES